MSRKKKVGFNKVVDYYFMTIAAILVVVGVCVGVNSETRGEEYNPRNSVVKITENDSALCAGVRIGGDLVLTNAHCVDGVETRGIETASGLKGTGKVLWRGDYKKGNDLALLQVDIYDTKDTARIDCKAGAPVNGSLKVGDEVIAIGMPAGFSWAQTRGYVSAIGRQGRELDASLEYKDLIELNVTVIGGNSGGGLFTLDGRFVGMPSLAMRDGGTFAWAIPAVTICKFLGRS